MPGSGDTRVVEMQFQNRQFERNIAKSKKSLQDFKKELQFEDTTKGLARFTSGLEAIDFKNLTNNVQALTDKFTGLGDVGEYVISRIRHELEGAALQLEGFLKSFTTQQIGVGQGKYDALNKAVQAIVAAGKYSEEQAYTVFERVMSYTDQTSASFMDMVNQIASFTAVGQTIWDSEKAMEGIFNMSAKAGRGVAEASAAMNIFSKAMGQGYLSLNQFQSLTTTARIADEGFRKTLLETAVETKALTKVNGKYYTVAGKGIKKMEVTANNLEETLKYKWLKKDTLMAFFNKYYYDFEDPEADIESFAGVAYKSAQRALTFADAMQAIKESVSSGWMKSFRIIFGDVSEAMKVFTGLCDKVIESLEGIAEARNRILEAWSNTHGREAIIEAILGDYGDAVKTGAYGLLDLFKDIGDIIAKGFWDMVKLFAGADQQLLWDYTGYKEAWFGIALKDAAMNIRDFIASIKTFMTEEVKIGDKTTSRIEMVKNAVDGIAGAIAIGIMLIDNVVYFIASLKQKLQPALDAITNVFSELGKAIYDSAQDTQRANGKNGGIRGFFDGLLEVLTPLTDGINILVGGIGKLIIKIIKWGKESGAFKAIGKFIEDTFTTINKVISAVGGPIFKFFGTLSDIIADLFDNGFNKESLATVGPRFKEAFKTMIDSILESTPESMKGFVDAIKDLFGLWKDPKDGDPNSIFTKIHNFLKNGFEKVSEFIKKIIAGFKGNNLFTIIKKSLGIGEAKEELAAAEKKGGGINLFTVLAGLLGVGSLGALTQFSSLMKKLKKLIDGGVMGLINGVKSSAADKLSDFSDILMKMAKAVGIFAAAIFFLGTMKIENLAKGILAIGLIFGAVYLFSALMQKQFKGGQIKETLACAAYMALFGIAVAAMAVGIGILILALTPFALMSWEGWARALLGLVAVVTVLAIFAKKIKEMELSSVKMGGLIGLAIGIGILVLAIAPFAMMSWAGWARSLVGLIAVVTILGVFAKKIKDLEINSVKLAGLTGLAIGIGILVLAIVPFALMPWEAWARSLLGLIVVVTVLGVFAKKIKDLEIDSVKLAGLALLAFGIGLLVLALTPFALMSWEGWARSLIGLIVVVTTLGVFAKKIKEMEINTVELAGLIGLAIGIGILILALTPLALMSWEGWIRSLLGLIIVVATLGIFAAQIKKMEVNTVALTGLIGFAIGIGILMLAIKPFAEMNFQGWLQSLVGFGLILAMLLMFGSMLKNMDVDGIKLGGLAVFVGTLGFLVDNVVKLAALDFVAMINAITGIGLVLLMIAGFANLIKAIKFNTASLLGILSLVAIVLMVSIALNGIKDVHWATILAFTVGLSALIIVFSLAVTMLGAIPAAVAIKGILVLALGIAAIVGIIALLAPLVLGSIGSALTDFVSKLTLVGEMLSSFSSTMKSVDEHGVDKASSIFDKLKALFGKLTGFGGYGAVMSEFTTALFDLGTGLQMYDHYTKDLKDPEGSMAFKLINSLLGLKEKLSAFTIGNAATEFLELGAGIYAFDLFGKDISNPEDSTALKTLTSLAGCANDLQTLQKVNLSSLTSNLTGLGGAMMLYAAGAKELTGLEIGETPDVEAAVAILQSVTTSLAKDGGFVIPNIPKESELGTFGADLAALSGAMIMFAQASDGFSSYNVVDSLSSLDFLADIKGKLSSQTLKAVEVFGEAGITRDELAEFALDIIELGKAMSDFAKNTENFGNNTEPALKALDFFTVLRGKLVNTDFSVITIFGIYGLTSVSFTEFGKEITQLGLALQNFAESVNWDDQHQARFNDAIGILDSLATLKEKLPKVDGLGSLIVGHTQTFTEFGAEIIALGGAMHNFSVSVIGEDGTQAFVTPEQSKAVIGVLTTIWEFAQKLGTEGDRVNGIWPFLVGVFAGNKFSVNEFNKWVMNPFLDICNSFGRIPEGVLENGKPKITKEALQPAIDVLDIIWAFAKGFTESGATVDGILPALFGGAFVRSFNIEDFNKFVLNPFIDICNSFGEIPNGVLENGKPKITKESLQPAIDVLDVIWAFAKGFTESGATVDGALAALFGGLFGRSFNIEDFKNFVITPFTDICGSFDAIAAATMDEHGPKITTEKLQPVIDVLDLISEFSRKITSKSDEAMASMSNYPSWWGGTGFSVEDFRTLAVVPFSGIIDSVVEMSNSINGKDNAPLITTDQTMAVIGILDLIIGFMTDLNSRMPKVGGLVNVARTAWGGENFSLTDLGKEIGGLGTGLASFNTAFSGGFNGDAAKSAVGLASSIADILYTLYSINGGNGFDVYTYMNSLTDFVDGLVNYQGKVQVGDQFVTLGEAIVAFMHDISTAIDSYGDINQENITMFSTMAAGLRDLASIDPAFNFEPVGEAISAGMALGISKGESMVTSSARTVALAAYASAMNALNAHSPSRLFIQVGGFIASGMSIGIDNGTNEVRSAAVTMSEEAIDGATSALSLISKYISEDLDANPTITPVIDLTNVATGLDTMDRMMRDNDGMSLDTRFAGRYAASNMPNTTTPEINQNGTDYSGIYDRMMSLGSTIAELGDKIQKMKLVMDTGAVVGAVSDGVDQNIGRNMFYAERGD